MTQRHFACGVCSGKTDHEATCYARATLRNALHIESEFPGRGHGVRYLMQGESRMFDIDGLDGLRESIRAAQRQPDVFDEESLVDLMRAELARLEASR
jgi:hypothetical protein